MIQMLPPLLLPRPLHLLPLVQLLVSLNCPPQATRSVGFDLGDIPTVDSGSLFRACPETMYDFGSMTSRIDEDTEVEISAAGSNNGGFLSFIGEDYFLWIKD